MTISRSLVAKKQDTLQIAFILKVLTRSASYQKSMKNYQCLLARTSQPKATSHRPKRIISEIKLTSHWTLLKSWTTLWSSREQLIQRGRLRNPITTRRLHEEGTMQNAVKRQEKERTHRRPAMLTLQRRPQTRALVTMKTTNQKIQSEYGLHFDLSLFSWLTSNLRNLKAEFWSIIPDLWTIEKDEN